MCVCVVMVKVRVRIHEIITSLCVFDSKKKLCALYGKWTECLYVVDPSAFEAHKKNNKKGAEDKKGGNAV